MLTAWEIACMTSAVSSSLDVSLTIQRRTPAPDGYGHTTETWTTINTEKCNVFKPSATQLQAFAGIIGAQNALMIRMMPSTSIREGDSVIFAHYGLRTLGPPTLYGDTINYQDGSRWLVQNVQNAESYTIALEALITVII